jgi:hypothetical protein
MEGEAGDVEPGAEAVNRATSDESRICRPRAGFIFEITISFRLV